MRTKYLFLGAIFAFLGMSAHGQVFEMYSQGFETGEAVNYVSSPAGAPQFVTNIYSGGERAMKLVQQSTSDVEFVLDTLDFTSNTSLRYISLRFDHICRIPVNNVLGGAAMGKIYYKRANQTEWTAMSNQEYNIVEDHSTAFGMTGAFNENSYLSGPIAHSWYSGTTPTVSNEQWHSERFDLDNVLSGVAANERKVLIKFVLRQRDLTTPLDVNNTAWWIDNIRVQASAERMVKPRITMLDIPHIDGTPNTRGARVALKASTTVPAGINADSVIVHYTIGSDPTVHDMQMTPIVGQANAFEARLPFCGYDTLMRFYCSVCDATGNANKVTYPTAVDSWVDFRCVRGPAEQPGIATDFFTGTTSNTNFPFPLDCDNKVEFVYDSVIMAAAGYGPGAIVAFRFMLASNLTAPQTRPRVQIRMRNVPTDYSVDVSMGDAPFCSEYMKVVYDSVLPITTLTAGLEQTITLQDTFFYAGKDLIMQMITDGSVNYPIVNVKTIPAPNNKQTLTTYFNGDADMMGYDPFTSEDFMVSALHFNTRPAFVFTEHALQPLLYDAGISELVSPNYDVPMTERPGTLTVKLKNYGERVINEVRISYNIDDSIFGSYDWSGTLPGGAETPVVISSNINIPAGFHTLCAWVEDSVTSGTLLCRDHEPYNDTNCQAFIVCDGPMNGVRNIGGPTPDFNTIEEFLFSLSRCGIDDSLVVRLAPGSYPAFTMPVVNGLTEQHYIAFESMGSNRATIYFDETMAQSSIVNLENVANLRLRNINFVRRSGALTDMVTLGVNSNHCRIEKCYFIDSLENPTASMRISAMINSGYASNLVVDSCTFVGGRVGADVKGQAPDIRSVNNQVTRNYFYNQFENAVKVENQDNVMVTDNQMYDVLSNSSYVVQLSECYGATVLEANKVYTSHGAGGVGISNVIGTDATHAIVANNMVVCNDDGSANLMRSTFNIIQANYLDVVYNSVKLTAPTRGNVAAATFGGGTLNNSRFIDNIVVSLDEVNYAFSYQANASVTNTVSNNVYYSNSVVLNRRGSSSYGTLAAWMTAMPEDSLSLSVNPNFLNGNLVDLRTYNRVIKGVGVPIANVPTDMFDTVRGDSVTCPGAFEFSSLPYDFEPEVLVSPLTDDCNMPDTVELIVRMRNSGINPYVPGGADVMQLSCRVNNGSVNTITVADSIPAEDTLTLHTSIMLTLPANGIYDATYSVRVWCNYPGDPNMTNDTNVFTVISRYHPAAPTDDTVQIGYATTATIVPTAGVNMWSVYNAASAPQRRSTLSWYYHETDDEPFMVGDTLVTDVLRDDTLFYVRQRRAMPIVRITQVELLRGNTAEGLTNPMPYWVENGRKAAVQLTNVGDATAYLEGDTLITVSPQSALNNKAYRFGNVKIEPGQSLLVQYVSNGVTDSSRTLRTGLTPTFAWNSNVAFVYKHNGVVEDALPLNAVISSASTQAVSWANIAVPSYVWNGPAYTFENNHAGLIRVGFDGNTNDWEMSTSTLPMFLGNNDPTWIRYVDNGCDGDMAHMVVIVEEPPLADIDVSAPILPENSCGLGEEDVTVVLTNFGSDTISNLVLNYCAGGDTVTQVLTGDILAFSDTVFTFTTKLNLFFPNDSVVTVRVWADSLADDPIRNNDTSMAVIESRFTPSAPDTLPARTLQYATCDTITHMPSSNVVPVWYDYDMNPVDTGYTYITEPLYAEGLAGMAYIAINNTEAQIGTGTTSNGNTSFPSPYQPSSKFVKQQYIYSASDMRNAGVGVGNLTALSFYLDTLVGSTASVDYQNYTIALGLTTDTIFSSGSDWKTVTTNVFTRSTFTINQTDDKAWVNHQFDVPFTWDGESSVVVQITYELSTAVTTGLKTCYTAKSNTTLHKNANSALSPSTAGYVGSGTKGNNRPNIKFASSLYGCVGPITPYEVHLLNMPAWDAAISLPDGFDTLIYNSCDTIALPVVVRNQGSDTITHTVLYYTLDNMAEDSTIVTDTILPGHMAILTLFDRQLVPGRHTIRATVSVAGDNISNNDTVAGMVTVRFCSGVYTIAATGTADYPSFGAAIDTLNQVGITGPVTFSVADGTYTEQVVLNNVNGSSSTNTISFVGQGDNVLLTASTSQTVNYVMLIDGAQNVTLQSIRMEARPTANNVNYANALVLQNDSNIHINNCYFKVKGTIVNANASCIVMMGNVSDLQLTNSVMDSGYYSLRSVGTEQNYNNIQLIGNEIRNFASGGVNLRGVTNLWIDQNWIHSGNSADNRGLIALYLADASDNVRVERNRIYLLDERKGAKRGIQLENVVGTTLTPVFLVNNMISTYGTDSKGLTPAKSAGIWVDSMSAYVNVFYNSVRVRATSGAATAANNDLSYGFFCGNTPNHLQVMNNVFSNFSYGYAYYVSELNTVSTSNFNAYYTEATKKFAWKQTALGTLTALQAANSDDANSLVEEPYFLANDDLHMRITNFVDKAQYNTDVTEDIEGNIRPQIPAPTIGAHEMERSTHDMTAVRIHTPHMPVNINVPDNIETDSALVTVSIYNNGRSNELNVQWYAFIDGYEATTRTPNRNVGSFAPQQMKRDSVMIACPLGVINTQNIHVVVISANDSVPENNHITEPFYLAPAFNLAAMKMEANTGNGCNLQQTPISIQVKNDGSKPIPANTVITIGYHTEITNPTTVTISTLPDVVEEDYTLENPLPIGSIITIPFTTLANLYPTDYAGNIKVRVRGWCNYQFDVVQSNDTTSPTANSQSPVKDSYYTPAAPYGHDTTFAYGTWGEVLADQENSRPIRWYRDTTANAFYAPSQYNLSRKWSNTPQFFHDSTYYLNCSSDKNCVSAFSSVTVHVMAPKTRDMAVKELLAPLGGRVYMENDTVRVRIINYGTAAQSNFPVTYQLKRGNNILQTVTETVTATIATNQEYDFTFDSLLSIPTPKVAQNYSINIWTDLTNDGTRRNDTLPAPITFSSLAQDRYNISSSNLPQSPNSHFDITRISYNGIDIDLPKLDRSYTNLADYDSPDYPVLHVTRGTSDSLIFEITPLDPTEQRYRCRATVSVDFNRNGLFQGSEIIEDGTVFWCDSVFRTVVAIPNDASYGYMRMRVMARDYESDATGGHIVDFLLFVDAEASGNDLAITQMVSPRNHIIRNNLYVNQDQTVTFKLRLTNRGQSTINGSTIYYKLVRDEAVDTTVMEFPWTGMLAPGTSTVVTLPPYIFEQEGVYAFTAWHQMLGDENTANDTLFYDYYRPYVKYAAYLEEFEGMDYWYTPQARSNYTRNFWQRGMPNKTRLDTTYSGENAWVTDLNSSITTGRRGSVSYLYSPIFDIAQIGLDTLTIRLRRNLTGGSSLHLEYYNYLGRWVKLDADSILTWYNDPDNRVFSGTSSNSEGYARYVISVKRLRTEMHEKVQFRFVYTTPMGSSNTSSYGEGCAVDDFFMGRARGKYDVGLIAIPFPTQPKYGQTIYPQVVAYNYGTDTLRNFQIRYTHYGTNLPKITEITNVALAPGESQQFTFDAPFTVTSDYPDSFYIRAWAYRSDDNFHDNDTVRRLFYLSPLDNDISAVSFLSPLNHVVAGDTAVPVTMRIHNFGLSSISSARFTYSLDGGAQVTEEVDFTQVLGRPLQSMEYFNYTFHRKIRAAMGVMRITAFVKCDSNDYIYNDTITKRFEGIMSVTDVAVSSIILDTTDHNYTYIGLVLDNRGARGVNNFEVGFWIDNDTSTIVRETYYRSQPLPALNTGYYLFSQRLPSRTAGYNYVTGFVSVPNDNDPSNDTANVFASRTVDIEVVKVLVEENASNDCRVFLEMRNVGNAIIASGQLRMRASINGGDSNPTNVMRRIEPGESFHMELNRRIPKSPTRHYVGSGWISKTTDFLDFNEANNQTSVVEVINYMEGTPTVNGERFVLDQNYPNPFSQQTTIPFTLPRAANVRFFVMDALGHIVHRAEGFYQAGGNHITIDMEAYAAGIYYYGIEVDGQRQMRKMILR